MFDLIGRLIEYLGKLFFPVTVKQPIIPEPAPVITPLPTPVITPTPTPIPIPAQVATPGPQSPWWSGTFELTQPWGCTHFNWEPHNPNHPDCDHWHDGEDYGLPCGTPIFAGGNFVVSYVDDPAMVLSFGVAALGLIAGTQGHPEGHDVWLLHMQDYAVKFGDSVQRGALLGHSGTRGLSTGCHLHFQVVPRGGSYFSSIDPEPWVHMLD